MNINIEPRLIEYMNRFDKQMKLYGVVDDGLKRQYSINKQDEAMIMKIRNGTFTNDDYCSDSFQQSSEFFFKSEIPKGFSSTMDYKSDPRYIKSQKRELEEKNFIQNRTSNINTYSTQQFSNYPSNNFIDNSLNLVNTRLNK